MLQLDRKGLMYCNEEKTCTELCKPLFLIFQRSLANIDTKIITHSVARK